jgi:hypothetical protein
MPSEFDGAPGLKVNLAALCREPPFGVALFGIGPMRLVEWV